MKGNPEIKKPRNVVQHMKDDNYPTKSQLEDYITKCQSAAMSLCQKHIDRWVSITQSHERRIETKYNELAGFHELDKAQQNLGRLLKIKQNPSILNRLQGRDKISQQINVAEDRIIEIETKIAEEIEPLKQEMYDALQVEEYVNAREVKELAKSLRQWSPERRETENENSTPVRCAAKSRDSDDHER